MEAMYRATASVGQGQTVIPQPPALLKAEQRIDGKRVESRPAVPPKSGIIYDASENHFANVNWCL